MTELDSNRKSETTRGLKHKDLILCLIQYFGALLVGISLCAVDGSFFGVDIFIAQDIIIISALAGAGLMFWAYNRRKQIRGNRTPVNI